MIPAEVLKRIRSIEIKTRKIVNSTFSGEYHSVFKGQGMSFAEVREYQPGDDVRQIDWNVTAKMRTPFVKVFEEERELTVMLLVDLSASGEFGSLAKTKVETAAEIAAVLGFSAINNQDQVGLLLFSDQIERYIPPQKRKAHIMRLLREIFYCQPKSKKTSIAAALEYLLKICKKKCIVFVISDFIDTEYHRSMKAVAKKHDLIPVFIEDPREMALPACGLLTLEDEETGETLLINTNDKQCREKYANIATARKLERERFFKKLKVEPITVNIADSYTGPLFQYFKHRAKKI